MPLDPFRPLSPPRRRSPRRARQLTIPAVIADDSPLFTTLDEVIVVDTETTGTGSTARVVEIAAVHAIRGVPVREFQSLVHPGMKIPPDVIRIHGITDAMVRNAPRADAVLPAFMQFVGALPLVAHNAGFDRGILSNELQRARILSPGIPVYCTVRLARKAIPEAPNHRLGTLAEFLALKTHPTHRALADCHAALGVLRVCTERLPGGALLAKYGPVKTL